MTGGNLLEKIAVVVDDVVIKRLRKLFSWYFESYFAVLSKAAVRLYFNDQGDDYWFPCSVHFAQFAMRDDVQIYLCEEP